MSSPHWAKTMANALVFVLLVVDGLVHLIKKEGAIITYTSTENKLTGNVAQQLVMMSLFFFWLSIVSFTGTQFMAGAHLVGGVNVWELVQIQNIGAISTSVVGTSMLGVGMILKQIHPTNSVMSAMEGK